MRILVTGGAGYIGSHTVLELLLAGHEVLVVENFMNGHRDALRRVEAISKKPIAVVEGDLRNPALLNQAFLQFQPEAVVHFAGLKAVAESTARPLDYYDVNVIGSIRLLETMQAHQCRAIVFSSSATVYGAPEYLPLDESHPTAPVNPYGRTKLMVEQILNDWCMAEPERSAISLRYFNPVGAHPSALIGEAPTSTPNNLMPLLSQAAVGRRAQLEVFGTDYNTRDGSGERDFIHVVDLAKAHVAAVAALAEHQGHEIVNVGTGNSTSVLELIAAFERVTGCIVPVRLGERRPGDVAQCYANADRATKWLSWEPQRTIDEMCADTWAWQFRFPQGYDTPT